MRVLTSISGGALACLAACALSAAHAQSPADFYQGKTVELYIGYSAGGGYDVYARALARHMGRHIAGNPTIVPKNMPGAGSLVLGNWLYNVAAKDGTVFGMIGRGVAFDPLLGSTKAQFDASRFNWIGSMNDEVSVCVAWHTSGVTRLEQVMQRELTVGGSGPAADTDQFPKVLNDTIGTRFKIITGYPGGNDIDLAMERGEVMGRCGWSWSSVIATHKHWLDERKISVLVQLSLSKHPDLPNVPLIMDFARNEEEKQIFKLVFARQPMGRPFLAPPGIPPDRAAQGIRRNHAGCGLPRREPEDGAGDQPGFGRGGASNCRGSLCNSQADRREGGEHGQPVGSIECRNASDYNGGINALTNAEKTVYRRKETGRMRYWLLVLPTLVLSACQSAEISDPAQIGRSNLEVAKPITLSARQISSVRSGVARVLKNNDLEDARFGRMLAGRTSTAVIVCGYVDGKNSSGEYVGERPYHGLFLGMDNASSFIVTGSGGTDSDNAATFEVCRRSGLDLAPS